MAATATRKSGTSRTAQSARGSVRGKGAAAASAGATLRQPLNITRWVAEHRHLLKAPLGSKCIYDDGDFLVMAAGGPLNGKDFHINPTDELFFQLEGDVVVRVVDAHGQVREIPIREGEMFLLPANVPHSPQRAAGTVGLVIERRRPHGEDDGLRFYCERCGEVVFEERFEARDMVGQLRGVMETFWSDATLRTCMQCGFIVQPASGQATPPSKEMACPTDVRVGSKAATEQPKPASTQASRGTSSAAAPVKRVARGSIDPRNRR